MIDDAAACVSAIIDAGLSVQLDDPAIGENWDQQKEEPSVEGYRRYTKLCIDALNHSIKGLPPDKIRFHLCWGSWHGPHTTDIPMQHLANFLKDRSCEVLINLMTRHIIRFLDQPDRAQSYHELFGRSDVLPRLQATPSEERADVAVREYCRSLRTMCGFKYVSSAVILEPDKEDKRYFLVYATNHPRGVEVFKAAETKAAKLQDDARYEAKVQKTGQPEMVGLFGGTPKSKVSTSLWQKYCERAKAKVVKRILDGKATGVSYSDLFCEAMAFPLVTPMDLRSWMTAFGDAIEVRLAGSGKRREPSPAEDDWIFLRDSVGLSRFLH